MAEPAPILQLEGLRKRFGGLAVTDDVSLAVAPRGILGWFRKRP